MKKHNILKVALWVVPVIILLLAIIFPNKGWAYLVNLLLAFVELFLIVFKFKDKHNANKVILATTLCFMLLAWLLPAAYFSGEYIEQGRVQMGLFDLLNYPVTAVSYFGYIACYILFLGAFYGVLNKIPAYRAFLDKMVNMVKGTEKFVLFIIMFLLAVLTSLGGMQLALLALFPMLVSFILLMGFDKMVAAFTLIGSTMVGIAGTTYGYGNVSVIYSVFGLELTTEVITKVVILVLGLLVLVVNTLLYIKKQDKSTKEVVKEIKKKEIKVEKKTTKSKTTKSSSKKNTKAAEKEEDVIIVKEQPKEKNENAGLVPENVETKKHSVWPFFAMFLILFVIIILAFMPWVNGFGLDAFDSATDAVVKFELFGFPIFDSLFGTFNAFGYWSVIDLTVVLLVLGLLLVVIYKVKFSEVLDAAYEGIKKALPLAIVTILIYTCLVVTTYHPFQLEIYKALLGVVDKFNVLGSFVVSLAAILSGIFNAEAGYAFQSVLPYLATVITDVASYPAIAVIFQAMYGFAMLFAPTSLILMLVLSYLDISYTKWLKTIWKLLLELLVILLIVFVIIILL